MKKSDLVAAVDAALEIVITKAKVLLSSTKIIDELYPASVVDNNTTQTYTTKAGTNITYSITIVKSGNIAHVKGTITNVATSAQPPQTIFSWKDTPYRPISGIDKLRFLGLYYASGIAMEFDENILFLRNSIPLGGVYDFDFKTYITQE